jgi:hypothetical protein
VEHWSLRGRHRDGFRADERDVEIVVVRGARRQRGGVGRHEGGRGRRGERGASPHELDRRLVVEESVEIDGDVDAATVVDLHRQRARERVAQGRPRRGGGPHGRSEQPSELVASSRVRRVRQRHDDGRALAAQRERAE